MMNVIEIFAALLILVISIEILILGIKTIDWIFDRSPKRIKRISRMAKRDKGSDGRPCSGDNNIVIGCFDPDEPVRGAAVNSGLDWTNALVGPHSDEEPFKPTAYDADLPE